VSVPAPLVDRLSLQELAPGTRHHLRVWLVADGLADRVRVPAIVVRGRHPGPVVGVVAALHGNELNGIPVIHQTLRDLDPETLRGTVVGVPVLNVPGYHLNRREYLDGVDPNRVFPGREGGTPSQVFCARLMDRVIREFDYLVDLHTASFGRANSLYVRANLDDPVTSVMARLQAPQILLHNFGTDGTLRSAAAALGIHAITVEIGNPQRFQEEMIKEARRGIENLLVHLGMTAGEVATGDQEPVVCGRSSWLYTRLGGVLEVFPRVTERVSRGQLVARITNPFGELLLDVEAPEDGIVIGKSTNPVAPTGSRIVHLGVLGHPAGPGPDGGGE
jgi:predicted deacylase